MNRNGFGFLLANGVTWLVASVTTLRFGGGVGAHSSLLQRLLDLPLGLLITALTQTGSQPDDSALNELRINLSLGQLLVLAVAFVMLTQRQYEVFVAALAMGLAVHVVPYSWLYATSAYTIVAILIAVDTGVSLARGGPSERSVAGMCAICGASLLLGSIGTFLL